MTVIGPGRAPSTPIFPSSPAVDLRGEVIIVIGNPAARDGQVAREFPQLKQVLEGTGAKVVFVETLPDLSKRRDLIRQEIARVLVELGPGKSVYIVPYGGDGTIWETVGEATKAAGGSLEPRALSPEALQGKLSNIKIFLVKKGTAADNAVQVRAPEAVSSVPTSMRGAVGVPFRFPTVETREAPNVLEAAGHTLSFGAGGFLFHQRSKNREADPHSRWNRGIFSFIRVLPRAVVHPYGRFGFDAHLSHFDANGNLIREATVRASDVITTPNHVIAKFGGLPGFWGDTKVVVLPPGAKGLVTFAEAVFRRVATALNWNLMGPGSLRTLSADHQWLVKAGEKLDVHFTVPSSGSARRGWDRLSRRLPGEIPAAGAPLPILGQRNGDAVPPSTGFTLRPLPAAIDMPAHPDSLAVQLARQTAMAKGEPLPVTDQQVTSLFPENSPQMWTKELHSFRVRTPFVSHTRLNALLDHYQVPRQYGIDLMLAAHGTPESGSQIAFLNTRDVKIEKVMKFLDTKPGWDWIGQHRSSRVALRERSIDTGAPLLTGFLAMFGGEALADRLGLDAVRDRELRFGLVTYTAHAVQANVRPLWHVAANRWLGRPYDFLQTRSVSAAGEVFSQWSLEYRGSWTRALASSWASQHLGVEMGLVQSLRSRLPGWGKIPFRAAWNMGEGLIFSRATEFLLSDLPDDSRLKHYAPTAAFFVPDVIRMTGGPRFAGFLESRPMRLASRAVAAGFISDMAFTAIHRMAHGAAGDYQLYIDHRAANLRRARGDSSWVREIPRFLAPSLSAYIDSHDFFFGDGNSYRREIEAEDVRQSAAIRGALQQGMAWLPSVLKQEPAEIFSRTIQLSPLERDIQEHLSFCRGGELLKENAGFEETARYLKHQFRGPVRTLAAARRHLARVYAAELQQSIAGLHHIPFFENATVQALFDASGRLRPGLEEELNRWILTGEADPILAGFRRAPARA